MPDDFFDATKVVQGQEGAYKKKQQQEVSNTGFGFSKKVILKVFNIEGTYLKESKVHLARDLCPMFCRHGKTAKMQSVALARDI